LGIRDQEDHSWKAPWAKSSQDSFSTGVSTFFSVKIGRIKQGHHGLGWSGKIAKIISKINGAKRPGAWLKW
jgi:hypothetical protein